MARFGQSPFGGFGGGGGGAPGPFSAPIEYRSKEQEVTVGQFFNAVYAWMCVGLAVTAGVAWWAAQSGFALSHPGAWLICLVAQLALVWAISGAVNRINATMATVLFLIYAALNGVWLSVLFYAYKLPTLGGAFVVTAGMFGAMSLWGYVTKRDLTRLGGFLFMALIGLVLASIVNMFWANSGLYWIVTYAGVLIFIGLTAFDTQRLKWIAIQTSDNPAMAHRMAIVGSLTLYLDFINLFILLLRIMGDRRR